MLRARGADAWAAFALAAALLHTVNHALFKSLLFLGAGVVREGGRARSSSIGSAGSCGGCRGRAAPSSSAPWRSPGLPPLNGFASEWTTLQSLLHVPAYGGVADGTAGAIALAALAATAALAALCFVKVVGLVLLGPARRERLRHAEEAPRRDARGRGRAGRRLRRCSASRRVCSSARSSGSRRGRATRRRRSGSTSRARDDFRSAASRSSSRRWSARSSAARGRRVAAAGADLGVRSARRAAARLDERRLHQAAAPRARGRPAARARDRACDRAAASCREVVLRGPRPAPFEERLYRPVTRVRDGRRPRTRAACRAAGSATYVAYLLGLVARRAHRARSWGSSDDATAAAATAVQLVGGHRARAAAPGLVQHWKARLQGRRGPTPLQPYRELRRLWGKSAVDVEGAAIVYRLAPSVAAAEASRSRCCSSRSRPTRPTSGVGRDALVLAGLLALARFAARGVVVGGRERLRADGREPRPDHRRLRRGGARARARASRRSSPGTTDLVG